MILRIKMPPLIGILLPLCLLGFMGNSISFLDAILNGNTRWIYFAILLFYLMFKNNLISYWNLEFMFAFLPYLSWCFFSSFWSDVPLLSFSKSTMLGLTSITMIRAGIEWVRTYSFDYSLDYLKILSFVFLLTALSGKITGDSATEYMNQGLKIYTSLVRGSNMFSFMMASVFPFLLWTLYKKWANKWARIIWGGLTAICLYFLIVSFSRSSLGAVILIFSGFLFSFKLDKKILFAAISLLTVLFILLIYPSLGTDFVKISKTIIYKSSVDNTNLFRTREVVWQRSYEAAIEGGWFGLGYGVSFEQTDFNFDRGLTAAAYGREKGNSQLAIIEETGLIGFILYCFLLLTMITKIFKIYITTYDDQYRVLVGILSGMFIGMIFISAFEAWWDAPGGPEAIYFWLLVGIFRGIEITMNNKRKNFTVQAAPANPTG